MCRCVVGKHSLRPAAKPKAAKRKQADGSDEEAEGAEEAQEKGKEGAKKPAAAAAAAKPPRPSDVGEGKTVFVRSIPFEMEEDDLRSRFAKYGEVLYAKIVRDKSTGVSKGTGFVKVGPPLAVSSCVGKFCRGCGIQPSNVPTLPLSSVFCRRFSVRCGIFHASAVMAV